MYVSDTKWLETQMSSAVSWGEPAIFSSISVVLRMNVILSSLHIFNLVLFYLLSASASPLI